MFVDAHSLRRTARQKQACSGKTAATNGSADIDPAGAGRAQKQVQGTRASRATGVLTARTAEPMLPWPMAGFPHCFPEREAAPEYGRAGDDERPLRPGRFAPASSAPTVSFSYGAGPERMASTARCLVRADPPLKAWIVPDDVPVKNTGQAAGASPAAPCRPPAAAFAASPEERSTA